MKKIFSIFLVLIASLTLLTLSGCKKTETLLFLNWGEYINDDVVKAFEEEYNVNVIVDIADSNELFYSKIKSGTTAYDLVCPSDYMVEKMVKNDLLQKIDYTQLSNYDQDNFMPGVKGIVSEMNKTSNGEIDYYDYLIPYFWGTFGLMYNKNKVGLEEAVCTYGWDAYFNDDLLPEGTRVGMYEVPLFAYAAGIFKNAKFSTSEESDEAFEEVRSVLSSRTYTEWGTDTLKKSVAAGNLDLAFVYTGDCLDMLYQRFDMGETPEEVSFDIYIPNNTIAFLDSLVMPKVARHKELAYKFINYVLDTDNAKLNAGVVGYCTPLRSTYDKITQSTDPDEASWAYAVARYYPLPDEDDPIQYKGTPLTAFSKSYLTRLTNMINTIKTSGK